MLASISGWALSMQGFRKEVVDVLASSHDSVFRMAQPGGDGGEGIWNRLVPPIPVRFAWRPSSVGAGDVFLLVRYRASGGWDRDAADSKLVVSMRACQRVHNNSYLQPTHIVSV